MRRRPAERSSSHLMISNACSGVHDSALSTKTSSVPLSSAMSVVSLGSTQRILGEDVIGRRRPARGRVAFGASRDRTDDAMQQITATRLLNADRRGSSRPFIVDTGDGPRLVKLRGAAQGTPPLVAEII